jgi:hypothetical protein
MRTTWEAQTDALRRKHRALALEQATLKAKVEIGNMSEPQIQGLHEFASQTWAHFQPTSETLASKHRLFALLKLRVLLNMDGEGKRYAQVSCLSGPINGPVVPVSLIKKLELPPGLREQKYQAS